MVYVKGGAAITEFKASTVDTCTVAPCGGGTVAASGNKTDFGWALGGGFEWAWTDNVSLKAEYLFLNFDRTVAACGAGGGTAAGSIFCWNNNFDGVHTAKVGINYRFTSR